MSISKSNVYERNQRWHWERAIARREQRMKKETASKGLFSSNVERVTAFKKQEIVVMRGASRYVFKV